MAHSRGMSALLLLLFSNIGLPIATREIPPRAYPGDKSAVWSNETQQALHMRECISLAEDAVKHGGGPYGALIVDPRNSSVVATGRNHAGLNPIWHGEMAAITNLSQILGGLSVYDVAGVLELYTSAEPCPMCMSAIAWSGFGRVIYGTSIPFIERHGGSQIEIRAKEVRDATHFHDIAVLGGILANETDALYIKHRALLYEKHSHDAIVHNSHS